MQPAPPADQGTRPADALLKNIKARWPFIGRRPKQRGPLGFGMAEGPDENAPPQPILIHGGTPALETEALPNPWPSSVAQEGQSKVEVGSTQPYHGVSNETIQAYEIVLRDKPNSTPIGLLGIVFLFVVPFGFLYMADFDVLFSEGEELCCGSMLLGAVLLLLSFLQESAWNSRKKMAQNRLMTEAGIAYPPVPQWPSFSAAIFLILAFILADLGGVFCLFSGMFGLIFLGIAGRMHTIAQKSLTEQLKLITKK